MKPPLTFGWRNLVFGHSTADAWAVFRVQPQSYSGLSAADKVQVRFAESGATPVDASVDVSQSDSAWWKSLAPDLQSALSYPDQAPIRRGEEENVFAYIPIARASSLPSAILFTVSSYSSTPIQLREMGTAKF